MSVVPQPRERYRSVGTRLPVLSPTTARDAMPIAIFSQWLRGVPRREWLEASPIDEAPGVDDAHVEPYKPGEEGAVAGEMPCALTRDFVRAGDGVV